MELGIYSVFGHLLFFGGMDFSSRLYDIWGLGSLGSCCIHAGMIRSPTSHAHGLKALRSTEGLGAKGCVLKRKLFVASTLGTVYRFYLGTWIHGVRPEAPHQYQEHVRVAWRSVVYHRADRRHLGLEGLL